MSRLSLAAPLIALTFAYATTAYCDPDNTARATCDAAYERTQELRDQGHLVDARTEARKCALPVCRSFVARDCTNWLAELEQRMARVVPAATTADGSSVSGVTVRVDSDPTPRPVDGSGFSLDPGTHRFVFTTLDGQRIEKTAVVFEGGKSQPIRVTLMRAEPPSAPPPERSGLRTASYGALAGAGVGLLTGAVFGAVALSTWNEAKGACPSAMGCSASALSERSETVTYGTVADVGFIAGGALAVTGAALWVASRPRETPVQIMAGPRSLSLLAKF